jgi:hypothetical protein
MRVVGVDDRLAEEPRKGLRLTRQAWSREQEAGKEEENTEHRTPTPNIERRSERGIIGYREVEPPLPRATACPGDSCSVKGSASRGATFLEMIKANFIAAREIVIEFVF